MPSTSHVQDTCVSLGSALICPTIYQGEIAGAPISPVPTRVAGLSLRLPTAPKVAPIFHFASNGYGFLDLPPGAARLEVRDPQSRYLSTTALLEIPNRRPLRTALEQGAMRLPSVPEPLHVSLLLRPAPGSPTPGMTLLLGEVVSGGLPVPRAWVRVQSPQGDFITFSDAMGRYLVPLEFLRAIPAPFVDPGDVDPSDDTAGPASDLVVTFDVSIMAYAPQHPVRVGDLSLDDFPTNFDQLRPSMPEFGEQYNLGRKTEQTTSIRVGTATRLDLAIAT